MIEYRNGDLLDSDADIIVHQVNCLGAFNSGLAGQIRRKWAEVYDEYRKACDNSYDNPEDLLGAVQFVMVDGKYVANCFGQLAYGKARRYTDYDALRSALKTVREFMPQAHIAIPHKIGCGLGGGDWNVVSGIIEETFNNYKGKVTIYSYDAV